MYLLSRVKTEIATLRLEWYFVVSGLLVYREVVAVDSAFNSILRIEVKRILHFGFRDRIIFEAPYLHNGAR